MKRAIILSAIDQNLLTQQSALSFPINPDFPKIDKMIYKYFETDVRKNNPTLVSQENRLLRRREALGAGPHTAELLELQVRGAGLHSGLLAYLGRSFLANLYELPSAPNFLKKAITSFDAPYFKHYLDDRERKETSRGLAEISNQFNTKTYQHPDAPKFLTENQLPLHDHLKLDELRKNQKDIERRIKALQDPKELALSYFRLMRKTSISGIPDVKLLPGLAEELVRERYPDTSKQARPQPQAQKAETASRSTPQEETPQNPVLLGQTLAAGAANMPLYDAAHQDSPATPQTPHTSAGTRRLRRTKPPPTPSRMRGGFGFFT